MALAVLHKTMQLYYLLNILPLLFQCSSYTFLNEHFGSTQCIVIMVICYDISVQDNSRHFFCSCASRNPCSQKAPVFLDKPVIFVVDWISQLPYSCGFQQAGVSHLLQHYRHANFIGHLSLFGLMQRMKKGWL